MVSAVLAFAGCQSRQGDLPQAAETVDTTESAQPAASEVQNTTASKTVEGTVTHFENGKDGYTAIIETHHDGAYQIIISRANLKDPKQFRHFNNNEIVKVSGDLWSLGQKPQITVREIL